MVHNMCRYRSIDRGTGWMLSRRSSRRQAHGLGTSAPLVHLYQLLLCRVPVQDPSRSGVARSPPLLSPLRARRGRAGPGTGQARNTPPPPHPNLI